MANETFFLVIRNRQEVIYKGQVKAVTSLNQKGRFDVLAHHAFFISIIEKYLIVLKPDNTQQKFDIQSGVIHVQEKTAHVYLSPGYSVL